MVGGMLARQLGLLPALVLTVGLFAACAHGKIQGTNIDDTDENREILRVVESYHRAVESRDADAVLAMVSPRYFEDNGNTDSADDYDYRGLSETLRSDFERTKAMQLEIRVDDVVVDEDHAYAYIMYTVRGQADLPSGALWKTNTDRARITFERQGQKWLIVAGL